VQSAGFIPCWVNSKAQPVPLGHTIKGAEVAAYVESLNSRSGLKADFSWSGDHVLFLGAGQSTGTRAANGAVSDARV
jgi:hypothetical protein